MKTVNTLAIAAVLSSLSFASFAAVEVQSTPAVHPCSPPLQDSIK